MTAVAPVTIVRRPISFKIFGIAVGLLVMMIFVTLYSSRYLSEVSEKLELLKSSYIELDQRMGNIRADLLVEVLLIERVLHYKPKVVDGSVAAAAAFYKEAGNCEGETLRAIYAKIRAAYPLRGEQQLMLYRVRRLCTQAKLQSADLIVDKALANTVVRNDPDQIARFSSIKADLQNIPQSRDKLHQYFEKYLSQLEKADEAGLVAAQEQIDERRADVLRRIGAVTRSLQKGTRDSADATEELAGKTKRISWLVTGVACVIGLLVAFFITRNLVAPVRELLGLTNSIRSGNLDVHIQIKTGDEIGMLADSFNHMVGEMRQKEQITSMFGKYVDPRIVKGLLLDEGSFKKEGERQSMSVFFSDLQGFTAASEALTPTGVVRLLNQYFSLMAEPIRAHQGIIDKYIGDSVMAFWGPPFSSPHEHAAQACFAALEQQARVPQFQALLPEVLGIRKNVPVIRVRMGIATGDVTVGSIGSEEARSYTVIGDNVNLASRLEGANKHYHTQILISEETKKLAGDLIDTREIDAIRVVGKTDPVRIYELLARKGNISTQIAALRDQYERGLQLYRDRNMVEAGVAFTKCLEISPEDGPAKLFLHRIEVFAAQAPAESWDGVWTMTEK